LSLYEDAELASVVERGSRAMNVSIRPEAALQIAARSRGTPRVALRLLRRVRDVADVRGISPIDADAASQAMNLLEIDPYGLDEGDRRILRAIIDLFDGGPVGLSTVAAALNEDEQTIEDIYEPYLIQMGFLERTPRGRKATSGAYQYMGYPTPAILMKTSNQLTLPFDEEA
jgi:Holliday junction DNA helicase RuvB